MCLNSHCIYPRMGGNLTLGLRLKNRVLSLNHASRIESRYRAGSRIYKITDPILGKTVSCHYCAGITRMPMELSGK